VNTLQASSNIPMKEVLLSLSLFSLAAIASAQDFSFAFEGDAKQRERLKELQGSDEPPALQVEGWMNSEPLSLDKLKGKVVVLDFWATWCGPCIRSIPKTNELMEKWGDKLVIIGICHPRGSDKMAAAAKKHGIKFPIAIDPQEKTDLSYMVNGYPDYFIIDQNGKLVVADCANDKVEAVVEKLLKQ
jgi:cytochrome c biogenesis protein CcmG/thiol:disulfide interchange protein DsbE